MHFRKKQKLKLGIIQMCDSQRSQLLVREAASHASWVSDFPFKGSRRRVAAEVCPLAYGKLQEYT